MLVARDQTSAYPDAVKKLPDIGYMRQLAPEGVLSVNPTGILLLEGSGPLDTLDVLKKASVPMIVVPETFTDESVIKKIEIVGKALGLEDKAKTFAAEVSRDIEAAEKAAAGHSSRKRVLFVLSAPGGRMMASGTGTAANGMIELAGGENVITEYHGYKQLTDEAIEKAAPDMILMMDTGADGMTPESLLKNPSSPQHRRVVTRISCRWKPLICWDLGRGPALPFVTFRQNSTALPRRNSMIRLARLKNMQA